MPRRLYARVRLAMDVTDCSLWPLAGRRAALHIVSGCVWMCVFAWRTATQRINPRLASPCPARLDSLHAVCVPVVQFPEGCSASAIASRSVCTVHTLRDAHTSTVRECGDTYGRHGKIEVKTKQGRSLPFCGRRHWHSVDASDSGATSHLSSGRRTPSLCGQICMAYMLVITNPRAAVPVPCYSQHVVPSRHDQQGKREAQQGRRGAVQ